MADHRYEPHIDILLPLCCQGSAWSRNVPNTRLDRRTTHARVRAQARSRCMHETPTSGDNAELWSIRGLFSLSRLRMSVWLKSLATTEYKVISVVCSLLNMGCLWSVSPDLLFSFPAGHKINDEYQYSLRFSPIRIILKTATTFPYHQLGVSRLKITAAVLSV